MLELAWNKTNPVKLSSGETRVALEDDDQIIFTGGNDFAGHRIRFGNLTGKILPAQQD